MAILMVVNNLKDFNAAIPGVEVITAKSYLSDPRFIKLKGARIFNLCRSYKYQSAGYYVSLLAAARGHIAIPNIITVQDTKALSIIRLKSDELENIIQDTLKEVAVNEFDLNIYFGKNIDSRFQALSQHLFNLFQSPLIKANFLKHNEKWHLHNLDLIPSSELPANDFEQVFHFAKEFFHSKKFTIKKPASYQFELAILVSPEENEPPSNDSAIKKFIKAAENLGIGAWTITKDEYNHLPEYDALFIRETTFVTNHTYRFARRAAVEGLVVIDDPESILKCCNKVYLAELLTLNKIPTPFTKILTKKNAHQLLKDIPYPLILKQPDSAFSRGVIKVHDELELESVLKLMFEKSDLIIAQEFIPTEFDWRIGIIDKEPLYACKYYMAGSHWQIIDSNKKGDQRYGKVETLDLKEVPKEVIDFALKAANLVGNGLYGVDLKIVNGLPYVIEINDNPNIESGIEDKILKNELYDRIMKVFLMRLQAKKSIANK